MAALPPWDTAKLVRDYLQEHAPAAEYVVVVDCGIGRAKERTDVKYVHWILCDQKGDWVLVDYQNSHHEDHQRTEPDSLEDCLDLVRIRLQRRLTAAN